MQDTFFASYGLFWVATWLLTNIYIQVCRDVFYDPR